MKDHNFRSDPPGTWRETNFEGADLRGAIFIGVDLTGSSFKDARLGPSEKGPASFNRATLTNTCFIGATLDATDFNYATFRCADFANTSLIKADFGPQQKVEEGGSPPCRTSFAGATLDVNAIALENWRKIDLSDAKLLGVSPDTFNARGADLTGAMLAGVELPAIDFSGANLTNADLSRAKLARAKFDQASLNGAKLSNRADLSFASFKGARFIGADLSRGIFGDADFTDATLDRANLRGARLSGATMRGTSLIEAYLEPDAEGLFDAASVLGADFTGANFTNAKLNHVQFVNVLLTEARFDHTTLSGTQFTGAIMPKASFTSATLQNVNFNGAILQSANFSQTRLEKSPGGAGRGVNFTCAQLGGANFTNARVSAADFESAVMPPESVCCIPARGTPFCGRIGLTQQSYGPVIFPVIPEGSTVHCPNGEIANCTETQWMIPNWRTRLCGAAERVWTKPDCDATPGETVKFNDANLKRCITESLPNKPSEVEVGTAKQILRVSCPARGIKDLKGLEEFKALTSLDLTGNEITRYALTLPKLMTLKIAGNRLESLHLGSDDLIYLDASNNKLSTLRGLTNVRLTLLDLSHNQFTEFNLTVHHTLVYADLSHNRLRNVLGSRRTTLGLTKLQYLNLSHNALSTIGSVTDIAKKERDPSPNALQSLFLACNSRFDCKSLEISGDYPALRKSSCGAYQEMTGKWIVRTNPDCPLANQ